MPAKESINPHVVQVPVSANPNQRLTFTVLLTGEASGTEVYGVSSSPSTAFVDLPTQVQPAEGQTSVQFSATLTSTISGTVTVTVEGSTGGAHGSFPVS